MSGKDKVNIFPSRMNLTIMKARLKGAQNGHSLLKKKADALSLKFRQIMKEIITKKEKMGEVMKIANFAFVEAKFAAGDFNSDIIQNVGRASRRLKARKENVAGVSLPAFECVSDGTDTYELTGLGRGGEKFNQVKKAYADVVQLLVDIASLQTSFVTLDEVIKATNRRVNAIEHVIIQNTSERSLISSPSSTSAREKSSTVSKRCRERRRSSRRPRKKNFGH